MSRRRRLSLNARKPSSRATCLACNGTHADAVNARSHSGVPGPAKSQSKKPPRPSRFQQALYGAASLWQMNVPPPEGPRTAPRGVRWGSEARGCRVVVAQPVRYVDQRRVRVHPRRPWFAVAHRGAGHVGENLAAELIDAQRPRASVEADAVQMGEK